MKHGRLRGKKLVVLEKEGNLRSIGRKVLRFSLDCRQERLDSREEAVIIS